MTADRYATTFRSATEDIARGHYVALNTNGLRRSVWACLTLPLPPPASRWFSRRLIPAMPWHQECISGMLRLVPLQAPSFRRQSCQFGLSVRSLSLANTFATFPPSLARIPQGRGRPHLIRHVHGGSAAREGAAGSPRVRQCEGGSARHEEDNQGGYTSACARYSLRPRIACLREAYALVLRLATTRTISGNVWVVLQPRVTVLLCWCGPYAVSWLGPSLMLACQ